MRDLEAIQADINMMKEAIGQSGDAGQVEIWKAELTKYETEYVEATVYWAEQDRVQAQEAEVQAITLPYDFDELFSEEGHPVTGANDMIIEVVKDTKRQANIEKNQALDEQKAMFDAKLSQVENELQFKIDSMNKIIENGTFANAELTREIGDVRTYLQQVNLERDDAFNKRDAAFRQLQGAQEEIKDLKTKLENLPTTKQSLDITPSDKLAQMVKESLAEKVNRGLARWPEIPTLAVPELEPVLEVEAPAEEIPFQIPTIDSGADTEATGNATMESMVDEESEVDSITKEEDIEARFKRIEEHLGLKAWNQDDFIEQSEQEVS